MPVTRGGTAPKPLSSGGRSSAGAGSGGMVAVFSMWDLPSSRHQGHAGVAGQGTFMADADVGTSPPDAALPAIGVELMSQNFRSRALTSVAAVAIVASGAVGAALYEG